MCSYTLCVCVYVLRRTRRLRQWMAVLSSAPGIQELVGTFSEWEKTRASLTVSQQPRVSHWPSLSRSAVSLLYTTCDQVWCRVSVSLSPRTGCCQSSARYRLICAPETLCPLPGQSHTDHPLLQTNTYNYYYYTSCAYIPVIVQLQYYEVWQTYDESKCHVARQTDNTLLYNRGIINHHKV